MAGPSYSAHGVGLFQGITSGGSAIPVAIGVTLLVTGCIGRLVLEQMKAASGDKPDFQGVIRETVFCFGLLMLHGVIAHNVWTVCQTIATDIYPDTKMSALAELMGNVAGRFKEYSFSVLDVGAGLKDTAVVLVALGAWLLALLSHWQMQTLQICVFNVIYAFGPFLIGLSLWGFGGRRIWFSALVEISSWSVTMAIVYATLDGALYSYLNEAKTLDFKSTRFIEVISLLSFMASLPFVVPIITGRLLGSQALGALGNVTAGGTFMDSVFTSGRQTMQEMGGGVSPSASDMSSHTEAEANGKILRRPGE